MWTVAESRRKRFFFRVVPILLCRSLRINRRNAKIPLKRIIQQIPIYYVAVKIVKIFEKCCYKNLNFLNKIFVTFYRQVHVAKVNNDVNS